MFLMEAYNQPYSDVMSMPSSRRHRLVKIREEIVRTRKGGGGGGTQRQVTYSTGLNPHTSQPIAERPSSGAAVGA